MNPFAPADLVRLAGDLLQARPEDRPTGREIAQRIGGVERELAKPSVSAVPFVGRVDELKRRCKRTP